MEKKREVYSLVTGVTYANVPSWYGAQHGDDLFFQDEVKDRVLQFLQRTLK